MNNEPKTNTFTELKGKLKQKFPALADSDLKYEESKKDEMITHLQTKLGKTKDEFQQIIRTL